MFFRAVALLGTLLVGSVEGIAFLPFAQQIDYNHWSLVISVITIGGSIVSSAIYVGYRVGRLETKMSQGFKDLEKQIGVLSSGNGPVCVRHSEDITHHKERLDALEDKVDRHHEDRKIHDFRSK